MPAKKTAFITVLSDPKVKTSVVRYDATDDDAALANAYINKSIIEKLGNPSQVKITIEAV